MSNVSECWLCLQSTPRIHSLTTTTMQVPGPTISHLDLCNSLLPSHSASVHSPLSSRRTLKMVLRPSQYHARTTAHMASHQTRNKSQTPHRGLHGSRNLDQSYLSDLRQFFHSLCSRLTGFLDALECTKYCLTLGPLHPLLAFTL